MKEKQTIIICTIICATLLIAGILFWPTLYRYDKLDKLPVKINRLTGYTIILLSDKWKVVKNTNNIVKMSQNYISNIKVTGRFKDNKYEAMIYNGTTWTISKIRFSIEARSAEGKIKWQKIYETTIDIAPFFTNTFSITLIDGTMEDTKTGNIYGGGLGGEWVPVLNKDINPDINLLNPEVNLKEIYGYEGD